MPIFKFLAFVAAETVGVIRVMPHIVNPRILLVLLLSILCILGGCLDALSGVNQQETNPERFAQRPLIRSIHIPIRSLSSFSSSIQEYPEQSPDDVTDPATEYVIGSFCIFFAVCVSLVAVLVGYFAFLEDWLMWTYRKEALLVSGTIISAEVTRDLTPTTGGGPALPASRCCCGSGNSKDGQDIINDYHGHMEQNSGHASDVAMIAEAAGSNSQTSPSQQPAHARLTEYTVCVQYKVVESKHYTTKIRKQMKAMEMDFLLPKTTNQPSHHASQAMPYGQNQRVPFAVHIQMDILRQCDGDDDCDHDVHRELEHATLSSIAPHSAYTGTDTDTYSPESTSLGRFMPPSPPLHYEGQHKHHQYYPSSLEGPQDCTQSLDLDSALEEPTQISQRQQQQHQLERHDQFDEQPDQKQQCDDDLTSPRMLHRQGSSSLSTFASTTRQQHRERNGSSDMSHEASHISRENNDRSLHSPSTADTPLLEPSSLLLRAQGVMAPSPLPLPPPPPPPSSSLLLQLPNQQRRRLELLVMKEYPSSALPRGHVERMCSWKYRLPTAMLVLVLFLLTALCTHLGIVSFLNNNNSSDMDWDDDDPDRRERNRELDLPTFLVGVTLMWFVFATLVVHVFFGKTLMRQLRQEYLTGDNGEGDVIWLIPEDDTLTTTCMSADDS